jgi:hypothetical protein
MWTGIMVTLKKLECSKQAYALNTLAWNNVIGRASNFHEFWSEELHSNK